MTGSKAVGPDHAGEQRGERYQRGIEIFKQLAGEERARAAIESLHAISPDLARFTVEFPYGDLLGRSQLDLKTREIGTVGALLAHGNAPAQLRFHMGAALEVGVTPQELLEIVIAAIPICGFACAVGAMDTVRTLFTKRDINIEPIALRCGDGRDRAEIGLQLMQRLLSSPPDQLSDETRAIAPELERWSIEFVAGEILSRAGLSDRDRYIAIVCMLTALGARPAALQRHLQAAVASGVSRQELLEILMQMSAYSGFPSALSACVQAHTLFQQPLDTDKHVVSTTVAATQSHAERREKGTATLNRAVGAVGDALIAGFDDLAPEIGRLIIEHAYGDIFARAGLDLKIRELAAVSAIAAMGVKANETPLKVHMLAALNVGATQQEIVEILYNLLPYCGYPVVEDALEIATIVFADVEQRSA